MTVDLEQLRLLPSIDELLQSEAGQQLTLSYSRPLALRAVRATIAQARAAIRDGALCPSYEVLLATADTLPQPYEVIGVLDAAMWAESGIVPTTDLMDLLAQKAAAFDMSQTANATWSILTGQALCCAN